MYLSGCSINSSGLWSDTRHRSCAFGLFVKEESDRKHTVYFLLSTVVLEHVTPALHQSDAFTGVRVLVFLFV